MEPVRGTIEPQVACRDLPVKTSSERQLPRAAEDELDASFNGHTGHTFKNARAGHAGQFKIESATLGRKQRSRSKARRWAVD